MNTNERKTIDSRGCLSGAVYRLSPRTRLTSQTTLEPRVCPAQDFLRIERFNQEDDPSTQREQTLHDITTAAWLMVGSLFRAEIGARQADGRYQHQPEIGYRDCLYALGQAPGMSATTGATGQTIPDENGQGQYCHRRVRG